MLLYAESYSHLLLRAPIGEGSKKKAYKQVAIHKLWSGAGGFLFAVFLDTRQTRDDYRDSGTTFLFDAAGHKFRQQEQTMRCDALRTRQDLFRCGYVCV